MKRHLILFLFAGLGLSACNSESSTDSNVNNAVNVPLGTIQLKVDGTQKTYTQLVSIFSSSDSVVIIHAGEQGVMFADTRLFIYGDKAQTYTISNSEDPGTAKGQVTVNVNGAPTAYWGMNGTVQVTEITQNRIAGRFQYTSVHALHPTDSVRVTDGQFNLNLMRN